MGMVVVWGEVVLDVSLPETKPASSYLKMDGWNTILSYWEQTCYLHETNIAPESPWLEDEFPFGKAYFQGRTCY